jgi:hypothetical protein
VKVVLRCCCMGMPEDIRKLLHWFGEICHIPLVKLFRRWRNGRGCGAGIFCIHLSTDCRCRQDDLTHERGQTWQIFMVEKAKR